MNQFEELDTPQGIDSNAQNEEPLNKKQLNAIQDANETIKDIIGIDLIEETK